MTIHKVTNIQLYKGRKKQKRQKMHMTFNKVLKVDSENNIIKIADIKQKSSQSKDELALDRSIGGKTLMCSDKLTTFGAQRTSNTCFVLISHAQSSKAS